MVISANENDSLTMVRQLVPANKAVSASEVLSRIREAPSFRPFDSVLTSFAADLSRSLMREAKSYPEIQALAFWLRNSEIKRLKQSFESLTSESVQLVPQGLVFHIPPANVDTIFVYSWMLSVLTGNKNIVRMSTRTTPGSELILSVIRSTFAEHKDVASGTAMVAYDRESDATREFSSGCDTRVIWGGDATISNIRKQPIAPYASELAFSDRFSMCVIDSESYASLDSTGRDELASKFYNDTFWFDQMGCSSPRLVIWIRSSRSKSERQDFYSRVETIQQKKNYAIEPAAAISKMVHSFGASLRTPVTQIEMRSNELTIVHVSEFPNLRGDFCGGGMFYDLEMESIFDLAPHVRRQDQTLTFFGIPKDQLIELVKKINGKGLDRIVPIGQALDFNRIWDGNDLIQSFSRRVTIQN